MPRLPDFQALGGVKSYDSNRPVASWDGGVAIGQGLGALSKGVGDLAADIKRVAGKETNQNETLEDARARSQLLIETQKIDQEMGQDTDHAGMDQRYRPRYQAAFDEAAKNISDPKRAELWKEQQRLFVERRNTAVQSRQTELTRKFEIGRSERELERLGEMYTSAESDNYRQEVLNAGRDQIDGLVQGKFITPEQAEVFKKQWVERQATRFLEKLPPAERVEAIRGGTPLTPELQAAEEEAADDLPPPARRRRRAGGDGR